MAVIKKRATLWLNAPRWSSVPEFVRTENVKSGFSPTMRPVRHRPTLQAAMPPTQLSAIYPSPKRKRDPPPFVPLLNTTPRPTSTPPSSSPMPSGADSPRTAVADQLRDMTIHHAIPMAPLTPTDDIVRKKLKLEVAREDSRTSLEDFRGLDVGVDEKERGLYITDTWVTGKDYTSESSEKQSQEPRIWSDLMGFAKPTTFASSSATTLKPQSSISNQFSKSKNRSSQGRPRKKSPSPQSASLTWQDSEITGHLVDPSTDPDDDGTGLNGIGFKPTPALAYARAQRRRQQVMDWRAREAREARAKRSERRQRGIGLGSSSRESTVEREANIKDVELTRRVVRFAA
ncbi:uncharacterized protein BDR25DRAFT_345419 [Lindgomyces ingoldianus]|uniref:Uncharacterized protein n=1 Tax=Lindgomyces ingoldianus TaxID=673940 RepID=A0ACB6QIT5_9PLEO|nr:uncharacterized protein BDR25DRAFT_345419 [Lindgomyces ingoldianus]KAF2466846.1 hypothetical protein BDR25DRAFT_345419 [Lindgomyces ingoldianus]